MNLGKWIAYFAEDPSRLVRAVRKRLPGMVHVGPRAIGKRISMAGTPAFKKTYRDADACRHEREAYELFAGKPWISPILDAGDRYLVLPLYPADTRLDRAVRSLSDDERRTIAEQAGRILFDIHAAGYAHRDFHAMNLFWIDGRLILIDFEMLTPYADRECPAFADSYDLTGRGLDSPGNTGNMCWTANADSPMALGTVLGIGPDVILADLATRLGDDAVYGTRKP